MVLVDTTWCLSVDFCDEKDFRQDQKKNPTYGHRPDGPAKDLSSQSIDTIHHCQTEPLSPPKVNGDAIDGDRIDKEEHKMSSVVDIAYYNDEFYLRVYMGHMSR